MDHELRIGPASEPEAFAAVTAAATLAFGDHHALDQVVPHLRRIGEDRHAIAARTADGLVVGTATAIEMTLSLPWASPAPCAGVTTVTTRPTHRRRGVLTGLMRHQLDDLHARGVAWAALFASESPIYGRFGYGPAAHAVHVEVDRPWSLVAPPQRVEEVALVDPAEAVDAVVALHAAAARDRPGMLSLPSADAWRAHLTFDPEAERDGAGPRRAAVLGDRAVALYRTRGSWAGHAPDGRLTVEAAYAADPAAGRALWSWLTGVDLMEHLVVDRLPVDDPLLWWLPARQRARITEAMACHARLVDVGAALSSRGTAGDGTVAVAVADAFCPWNAGTWRLAAADGGLRCARTDDEPEVALDVRELASLSLGGVTATALADAGLLVEHADGAARRLTALLAAPRAPFQPFVF